MAELLLLWLAPPQNPRSSELAAVTPY